MKTVVRGIETYQRERMPEILPLLRRLAEEGQRPEALLLTCADSRVVPGIIASTEPGVLFTIRNVGNIVPIAEGGAHPEVNSFGASTGAALEYSIEVLGVQDVIILGHADCGAMKQLEKEEDSGLPHLEAWLANARPALLRHLVMGQEEREEDAGLASYDILSRVNVTLQLEHLASYPAVQGRMKEGALKLHGWWFDLRTASLQVYDIGSGEWRPFSEMYRDLLEPDAAPA